MTNPRFFPGSGRERPSFKARRVACPHCAAPIEIKNEASRLVVCSSCGSHLQADAGLSETELKVLGQPAEARSVGFELAIGDTFLHDKARFEVIGRLALQDAWDAGYDSLTLQYLLYHPRRGSKWLSSYEGNWDLTETVRVQPVNEPWQLQKGDDLKSYDGRKWVLTEVGRSRIFYVDGALPWMATVGEESEYAELASADGRGEIYEVERRLNEQEVGRGRWLTTEQVRQATGREVNPPLARRENVAEAKTTHRWLLKAAAVALAVNLVLFFGTLIQGKKVLTQKLAPDQLNTEVMTNPFEVRADGHVIKVAFEAPLNNAWMAIDWALVKGDDEVIHVDDRDLEYYHGVEGGESWSEGNRSTTAYLKVDEAGTYRLLVQALTGKGNAVEASASHLPLQVKVWDGVRYPIFSVAAMVLSLIALIGFVVSYQKWKQADEED